MASRFDRAYLRDAIIAMAAGDIVGTLLYHCAGANDVDCDEGIGGGGTLVFFPKSNIMEMLFSLICI